jgi:hypothetical protein
MKRSIGQHYVPKFYLRGFTTADSLDGKLWVYDKDKPTPRLQSPAKVAKKNNLYSLFDRHRVGNVFEEALSKIESSAASLFRRLQHEDVVFTNVDERYTFGKFVSFLAYRTPQFNRHLHILAQNLAKGKLIKHFEKKGGLQVAVEEFNKKTGYQDTPEKFLDSFNKMKIKPPKGTFQLMMVEGAKKLIPHFCTMRWHFLRSAADNFFVTTDAPVVFHDPKNDDPFFKPGILQKSVQILIPVNKQLCLVATWKGREGYYLVDEDVVRETNNKVAGAAERFLFSPMQYDIRLEAIKPTAREEE